MRIINHRSVLCGVLLAVTTLIPASATGQSDPFVKVREMIGSQMLERNVPSVAIAVARDGRIVWEEAFGWADRERRIPATPHATYSIASVSKPFTATGLMVLRQRGLLDLDRPINDYLGDARIRLRVAGSNEPTVRQVANHSAGLPLHFQFFYADEVMKPPAREDDSPLRPRR
jgi:CubicO group peptidase (beta-lactamase class C family)